MTVGELKKKIEELEIPDECQINVGIFSDDVRPLFSVEYWESIRELDLSVKKSM